MAPLTAVQFIVAAVSVIDDAVKPVASPHKAGAPIVKSTFEISKKILPTDSTFTRQVVLCEEGTVMTSDPSLGVADASTVGNVCPPSVDNNMFTEAQLTDPALVPFTLQVTVADPPALQVTAVFGAVTANGPAVLVTVTTASVNAVWPTATGAVELNG